MLLGITPAWGGDAGKRLKALQGHIQGLSQALGETRRRQARLQEELARIEKGIARILGEIAALDEGIARHQARLARMEGAIQSSQATLAEDRRWLRDQLIKAYILAGKGLWGAFLEDAQAGGRYGMYYRYWVKGRSERIQAMRARIKALALAKKALAEERARLEGLKAKQRAALASLRKRKAERQSLLKALGERARSQAEALARLKADEERLAALLRRLPKHQAPQAGGGCRWPLEGRFGARFGQPRRSGLTWQGVLILAGEGRPVRSAARGKVVFADWLRGYGLLLIIDHGGGWMSLYGHNQRLTKRVGEHVEAGEIIAYVGRSGGQARPGLYFEVRRGGRPQDPAVWCQARLSRNGLQ